MIKVKRVVNQRRNKTIKCPVPLTKNKFYTLRYIRTGEFLQSDASFGFGTPHKLGNNCYIFDSQKEANDYKFELEDSKSYGYDKGDIEIIEMILIPIEEE